MEHDSQRSHNLTGGLAERVTSSLKNAAEITKGLLTQRKAIGGAALLVLAGCFEKEEDTSTDTASDTGHGIVDADGDGYSSDEDCNDSNSTIYPGATEICDYLDNDCDGTVDEDDAEDSVTWYLDADGDGYGDSSNSTQSCHEPTGYVYYDTDCDDSNAAINPGALEYCDGIDNNCDGTIDEDSAMDAVTWYLDTVGDGYGDESSTAQACNQPTGYVGDNTDCDDSESLANPGVEEICNDWIDNDCDGTDNGCTLSGDIDLFYADAKLTGEAENDCAGRSVAGAGDVDADGYDDFLVGAYGNDSGGDWAGAAYLVLGPVSGENSLSSADAAFVGEAGDVAGEAVSGAGDVNGDGYDDILVSAEGNDSYAGAAYLVLGPVSGELDLSDANAKLTGGADDHAGRSVAGAGDVNDDGYSDLLISAEGDDSGGDWAGAAYLVLGPISGENSLSSADAAFIGEAENDCAGVSVSGAGDVDGDGHNDFLVGAFENDSGGSNAGAVYLVHGPVVSGENDLGSANAKLTGEAADDHAGYSVAGAGDVDADGFNDLLIGAFDNDSGGSNAGIAYLIRGPISGENSLSSADAAFVGEAANDGAGRSVAGAGDVNADNYDDLLIGAFGRDKGGSDNGAAYVVLGGGL